MELVPHYLTANDDVFADKNDAELISLALIVESSQVF